jgi:hypothetical protein
MDINNHSEVENNTSEKSQPKSQHSRSKRIVVAFIAVIFALGAIAGGAYIIMSGTEAFDDNAIAYSPWVDLGEHYDLSKIKLLEEDVYHFNSYDISQGRIPFTAYRSSDETFEATVLGTGVWIRSYPKLKNRTKRCQVKSGDQLTVLRRSDYMDGKNWYYVRVTSGRRAGTEGYISADYVIEQRAYDLLQRFVFNGASNVNIKSPTSYLRALATVLVRLVGDKNNANLSVQLLDTTIYERHTIVSFQVRDLSLATNSSLLVFVQFLDDSDDFTVIGIVPGNDINTVQHNPNCSFDIYYY